ncbi:hypothetical protein SSX86_005720 [Deinandra increscens subsp. villosa]|uniref:protein disulfide-isomerase n=1 Tax=Deinandra increscens subsp. villosa TaxID=3103831 RepID=A0AAP0H748_9ASTR
MNRSSKVLIWISFLLLSVASNLNLVSAFYGSSSPVLQLTPSNFKSKVENSNGVVLVEFFAPWCGHCKSLTPTWEKVASVLKGVATVAAIDADAHQSIAQEYGIKGFPSIKVFVPGKPPVDYQGAREAKPIAEFALKQVKALLKDRLSGKTTTGGSSEKSEPSASVELNSQNFDDMVVKSKDLWMVEFFAPWCGHCKKLAPEWKKAAKNLQGKVKLGHVNGDDEKSLMSRYKVQGFPTILVFGADKDTPITYEGARTASAIESFALVQLETNVPPPEVTELTSPDVMEEKCGSAAICFVAFFPDILDSKAEGRNRYLDILLSVAEKFKRSPYSYVWAAAGKQPELEKNVGVGGYGYPALVALNIKKGAYAPLRSAFERDQIIEFVKAAGLGGKGTLPLEGTPTIVKTEAWDGKDGEMIEEDEFSLEELMMRKYISTSSQAAVDLASKDGEMRIFLVAGEVSGDAIGSRLIAALKKLSPYPIRVGGVGGSMMAKQGLKSLFPMEDIAVMGIWELLPHLKKFQVRLKETVEAAFAFRPHVVVTIDSKGFSFRLLKQLKARYCEQGPNAPLHFHYVAPSFWAWKGGEERLVGLSEFVDHVLCILPFEAEVCKSHGVPATFVGHPVLEDIIEASTVALCTSGTVAVELLLARLPSVVAYRAHFLTEWVIRYKAKVPYISLPNILLDSPVIPEALFHECTPKRLATMLMELMHNEVVREEQISAAEKVRQLLSPPLARAVGGDLNCKDASFDNSPSSVAAQTILYHQSQK